MDDINKWQEDFREYVNGLCLPKDDHDGIMEYISEVPSAEPEILACGEGELNVPGVNVGDMISRQAAIEDIRTMVPKDARFDIKWIEMWLMQLPSAQPEIIRCKDCKWKQGSECVRFADVRPFPDDFCSRAERRTDATD